MSQMRVDIEDGKYSVIQTDKGGVRLLRHGQAWGSDADDGVPSKLILAMAVEIQALRSEIEGLRTLAPAASWQVPCPVCNGTHQLREAVQAWDVPGAPVPECPYCDEEGTLDLSKFFQGGTLAMPQTYGWVFEMKKRDGSWQLADYPRECPGSDQYPDWWDEFVEDRPDIYRIRRLWVSAE